MWGEGITIFLIGLLYIILKIFWTDDKDMLWFMFGAFLACTVSFAINSHEISEINKKFFEVEDNMEYLSQSIEEFNYTSWQEVVPEVYRNFNNLQKSFNELKDIFPSDDY